MNRTKLTYEEYKKILEIPAEARCRESSGDIVYDKICGILIAFSRNYDMRDGWIDIMTIRDAEKEIKELITSCGGTLNAE